MFKTKQEWYSKETISLVSRAIQLISTSTSRTTQDLLLSVSGSTSTAMQWNSSRLSLQVHSLKLQEIQKSAAEKIRINSFTEIHRATEMQGVFFYTQKAV